MIAETVGASADILAAERMSRTGEQAFDITLDLDLDATKRPARLMERMGEEGSIDDYLRMDENEASSDFYV